MTDGGRAIEEEFLNRPTLLKIGAGFLVALALVYLLTVVIGWEEIRRELARAEFEWVAAACLSTAVGLVAWGKAWHVVLRVIGVRVPFRRLVVTYYAATFANYVTPFGQAGGEPFIAYVLSRDTDASYEDSLASVVTVDLLNLLPFFNFAAVGFAVLLLQANLPDAIRPLAIALTALAALIPALAYAGWNYRDLVEAGVLRALAPVLRRTERFSVEGVRARIERFYASLEVIAGEPREVLYTLLFSYIGWVFFALPMYLAGRAIGIHIDPALILFIVPASTVAGLAPTPGGLGGVETALVLLLGYLVPVIGVASGAAFTIATLYRVASYWFAILAGGAATLYVIARV